MLIPTIGLRHEIGGCDSGSLLPAQIAQALLAFSPVWMLSPSAGTWTETSATVAATAPDGRVRRVNQVSPLSGEWLAGSDAVRPYADPGTALWFDGCNQTLSAPAGVSVNGSSSTAWIRFRSEGCYGTQGLLVGGDSDGGAVGVILNHGDDFRTSKIITLRAHSVGLPPLTVPRDMDTTVLFTTTPTGVRVVVSSAAGRSFDTETVANASLTSSGYGLSVTYGGTKMRVYSAGLINGALAANGASETALLDLLDLLNGPATEPTGCPLLVIAGDSIAYSYPLAIADGWSAKLSSALSADGVANRWVQTAIPGYWISQMAADFAAFVVPHYSASRDSTILFAAGATNDLAGNTLTTAQIIAAYWSYCDTAQAAGFGVVACTVLPRSDAGINAAFETRRAAFNAAVVADYALHANALADVAAVSGMGAVGDSDGGNYVDKVHPSPDGHTLLLPTYKAAAVSLL